jgi:hypothetical protein
MPAAPPSSFKDPAAPAVGASTGADPRVLRFQCFRELSLLPDRQPQSEGPDPVSIPDEVSPPKRQDEATLERGLSRLAGAARGASHRMRLAVGLAAGVKVLPFVLVVVAVLLAVAKVRPSAGADRWVLVAAGVGLALTLASALRAALRRQAPLAGAVALDRHHGLFGRIASALEFRRVASSERTPLMQLAIEDGVAHAGRLDPRRAVRIPLPQEALLVLVLALGLGGLSALEVPRLRHLPPPPVAKPLLMGADDLELFRDLGAELAKQTNNPEQLAAVGRYNKLVEDIAEHRVDRHEVFRRLAEIERDLARGLDEEHEALDEGLEAVARELGKSPMSRKASEALSEKRLEDAEKALRELAQKLRESKPKPSAAEIERLRNALSRAAQQTTERSKAVEQRRKELAEERESLLKKKGADAGADPATDKKLEENKRKLERLERESSRAKKSQEQMSELDKELAKAAADLKKEMGDAAKDLEQGAQQINRMAREKLDDAQKRDLIRRLREMREVLRQEGQGGDARKQRLQRFSNRARGSKPGEGQGEGKGQGKGQGKGGRPEIRLGSGEGAGIEIPGMAQGAQQPGGKSGGDGQGAAEKGQGWGSGHDPNIAGDPSKLAGKTADVSAAGIDTGEGSASAEVIYGAAERGFTGKGYKDIFTDYETVSESVLEKDEIPSGYRFYVRRYFQLIRPRE